MRGIVYVKQRIKKLLAISPGRKFIYAGCLILIIGFIILALAVTQNKNNTPGTEPLITHSTDAPSESKEAAHNYNWRGLPDEPKRIVIGKLGIDSYIQKAGVDQHKKIAVPNNVHLAAWFAESAKPGRAGLSIIDGHVSGRTSDGIFKKLSELRKDDEFEIELGNGVRKRYKVMDLVSVKESESASQLFSQNPKVSKQLNLITCSGRYDQKTRTYDKRVIVTAKQIN